MTDLQVNSCEWYLSTNKANHHTDAFDNHELILRRGQPITITLNFNRPLQSGENVMFITETGQSPSEENKTRNTFPLFGNGNQKSWSSVLISSNANTLTVAINSPPDAVIGYYILSVSKNTSSTQEVSPQPIGGLYLLFNPWLHDDDVFLADENERQEYVLNERGVIFSGSDNDMMAMTWNYNQFEKNILEICFAILDRSINYQVDPQSDVAQRNDPLYVCRVLNATLNSKDENGVLVENWSGYYDDGVSPTSWNGSSVILNNWYFRGHKPVKYGQCWVYGGVLCTVLRCLGIPARVVTNFNSAQDKNGNLYIDYLYDTNGSSSEHMQDLIWNFHVWNEAWFIRKDMDSAYSGWQVMDATPLEQSEGIYRCGPAPLVAIKEGDVHLKYDVAFMYASVNADLTHWISYSDGTKKRISNDTKYIGKYISTKAVGSDNRVDVTNSYKYPEGSLEERQVFEKAVKKLLESPYLELEKKLLYFRKIEEQKPRRGNILSGMFSLPQVPSLGQDINLILSLQNLSADSIRVVVNMTASSILYTGRHKYEIWADAKVAPLGPNEGKHISIPLKYPQYKKYMGEDNLIRMTGLCEVEGKEERILVEKDIILVKPPITIKCADTGAMNSAFQAEVVITNTLSETMDSCILSVEGGGLIDGSIQKNLPPLEPGEKTEVNFSITPFKSGNKTLIAIFSCDKIKNIKSYHNITVAP
ncbi:protein-glutamine gamma-glutamyltransferase E-like [Hyla sarda]|uniref:protein-glutamine gamma-glutamyltransferase E-like n=1 Tax=Hyla sarda TaxID=327740 RepID=UPI0024C25000|nr:protein-glutamine gamma-glutamyltransferase E-like [Hyla sarda]XP_056406379.1 protein-glutamine gamma-glutamyltransferase E-like [Hyla sarda]XP_056406380.1 protein-glutamine gamma-glutamyltransferase E-like [Hyla sarda]XP_056406381.1 protein-glutamine gamma-glutamyltransferase E-like [Hyla sarda]XP_056406382.1 protein-glutamine gamma-glutamyltransferase E-like [Hyla sarda]XP_056406383.1 protein-glutamine gamma-glutamyltransferase E-like [Hyla sarda]XP_056406384.1 protein-glutamine gamma-gl